MKKLLSLFLVIPILASCSTKSAITDNNIAMMVNETPIYMDEYIYNYNYVTDYLLAETIQSQDSFSKEDLKLLREKTESQILYLFTVNQLAKDNNISLSQDDNEYIQNKIDEEIKLFGGLDEFNKTLAAAGLTIERYKEINSSGILHNKLKTFYFGADSQNPITEASFEDNYYNVKHILISKPEDGHGADDGHGHTDFKTETEAKALITDIFAKINAGEDFDTLINEYSEDPGLDSNPDGYHLKKGDAVAEFEEASLKLKENEISDIVETDFGYHIIKRLPLDPNFFNQNKAELIENETDIAMDNIINTTIEQYKITINDIIKDITPTNVDSYIKK